MSNTTPELGLIVQSVQSNQEEPGLVVASIRTVGDWLSANQYWTPPFERMIGGKRAKTLASLDALYQDAGQWKEEDTVTVRTLEPAVRVEILVGSERVDLQCVLTFSVHNGRDALVALGELGTVLWRELAGRAIIGPVFSVRPLGLPYPRPRPPRHSTIWPLGDAAYLISDEFHARHPLGDQRGVARLKERPTGDDIVRQAQEGLTVIRLQGPAEATERFALQRHHLEVWMSAALDLPLHPEFLANGDRRMTVVPRESEATPFTLYDAMRRIAFKAVAEASSGELDEATKGELKRILKLSELADGRSIAQTMVILPSRAAALANAALIKELGGAGAVFVGDDRRLWNPDPPGSWIKVDWGSL